MPALNWLGLATRHTMGDGEREEADHNGAIEETQHDRQRQQDGGIPKAEKPSQ